MTNNNGVIKVALTNLGKYNEGELIYTWLTLPATDEEITAAFEEIGVKDGTEYEEHFITDYEAPFSISEYASISTLNEKAELLSEIPDIFDILNGDYEVQAVVNLAEWLESNGHISDKNEYVGDFISDEDLDEYVANMAQDYGVGLWTRLKFMLGNIEDTSEDFYMFDGYANVCNITEGVLKNAVSDMLAEADLEIDE